VDGVKVIHPSSAFGATTQSRSWTGLGWRWGRWSTRRWPRCWPMRRRDGWESPGSEGRTVSCRPTGSPWAGIRRRWWSLG